MFGCPTVCLDSAHDTCTATLGYQLCRQWFEKRPSCRRLTFHSPRARYRYVGSLAERCTCSGHAVSGIAERCPYQRLCQTVVYFLQLFINIEEN